MKVLRFYNITKEQLKNTEYRPLGVEVSEIETEDGWDFADVIQNYPFYSAAKIIETLDGLIVWRVYTTIEYTDGTIEEQEFEYVVEITE